VAALLVASGCGGGEPVDVDRRSVAISDVPSASTHGRWAVDVVGDPRNPHSGVFAPQVIVALVGEPITWWFDDDLPHTVTSSDGGPLDSGQLRAGETYEFTFDAEATWEYVCVLHPEMTGAVLVRQG